MKMVEISYMGIMNELNKLNTRLEKAQKSLEKKRAAAEKLGVADMTWEEHREWLGSLPNNNGWLTDKMDIKKNGAWIDLDMAKANVEDIKSRIENAEKRFEKAEQKLDEYIKERDAVESLKEKEALRQKEFEAEQKEWAKDGITLERRYSGVTPQGKRFAIYGNDGWTRRSLHCFTLYLDGQVIFTSGEFWRAYGVIKNN